MKPANAGAHEGSAMVDKAAPAAFSAPVAAPAETLPTALPGLLESLWAKISKGLDGRWPPWSLPTLATIGEDGAPRARVLALRAVDANARRFTFHTDARSAKVHDLARDARASVLFWDPADAIQARFDGVALVHRDDADAAAAWRGVSSLRRAACAIEAEPGAELNESERFDRLPVAADLETPFHNFAVVVVEAVRIDWLWLGPGDMRRARFTWTGDRWSGSWIVP